MTRKDLFGPTSRYADTGTTLYTPAQGEQVACLQRRFIAPLERFDVLGEHVVAYGERLDNLAAQMLGDPEQFWRLCDANAAMLPDDLMQVGRTLRITMPEGMPRPAHE